jgi:hypothetical protein
MPGEMRQFMMGILQIIIQMSMGVVDILRAFFRIRWSLYMRKGRSGKNEAINNVNTSIVKDRYEP